MQPQYSQGAAPSHHPPPYTPPKVLQPNGGSTTSSLRQWRKKDFVEKQASTETNQSSTNENPSHIARVAPHTYYPRPPEDPCNYQQQYGAYSATYKQPAPVKYSEIVENQQPQTIEHITPVIQKQKEKEYVDMCNSPLQPHHIPMKQSTYPDPIPLSHQYIPKDSQMYPFLQKQPVHQYIQKEPYQQFLSKYNMQSQFPPQSPYNSQPNDFLAHLNKINPRMAQSIINDTHLRDTQIPTYNSLDQNRPYGQPQRMYHSPTAPCNPNNPQRNYNYPQYNYKPNISPGDPYNRVHQYASKYVSEQQRYYSDHMNYAPFPPNYQQLEYAQHYQHRRQFPQEYYLHPSYKGTYSQSPQDLNAEPGNRKSSLKQYLESWVEEDISGNVTDIIAPNPLVENVDSLKGTMSVKGGDVQDQPLYVLDTTDIPNDNLPNFLHLQQIEKLPDNIKGYYQPEPEDSVKELDKESAIIPEIFDRECSIVATVEDEKAPAGDNLENKVVQIHIVEDAEAAAPEILESESVIKMCSKSVVSADLSDSQSSFKSMPEINSKDEELPNIDTYTCPCDDTITNIEEAIDNDELVISNNCDTGNIPIDLGDITNDTNTSKDCETPPKTDLNNEVEDSETPLDKEVIPDLVNGECLESLLDEITSKTKEEEEKPVGDEIQPIEVGSSPVTETEPVTQLDENQNDEMPILEREAQDEDETNVVYQIDDSNVVLQIGDELLEINVTMQNDKKIIMVKTFSDTVIMNNGDDNSCPVLEEQEPLEVPPPPTLIENMSTIDTVEDICVYNEEIVSSSTPPEEIVNVEECVQEPKCLEAKPVRRKFKTKAALKLLEPQEPPSKPKPTDKLKKRRGLKGRGKEELVKKRKIESRTKAPPTKKKVKDTRLKRNEDKRDKAQKNDVAKSIDMLYKMSIVPSVTKTKTMKEPEVEEKINTDLLVSVQEHSITSSTCQEIEASDQRKRANKIIQQINDDWEDDFDTIKQEDTKRRLSLQEYNDRKRLQVQEKKIDYDVFDLTSNLLQNVSQRREPSPISPPELNVNFINRTYSRNVSEKTDAVVEKREEPLSSRIELQLPNQRRLFPKPNYNQEYLRNALMNDLHTVNQITATLMKENQQLMQRFLEQQRLTASELKKVKQIIRYKRLVHHLTNMKLKESQDRIPKEETKTVTEKRKKKRFRFLYTDSEPEVHEAPADDKILKHQRTDEVPAVDYSVHQSNSQGQLTLVFKRSFKSDPKMQPFVKLERIRSLDWLASKLQ